MLSRLTTDHRFADGAYISLIHRYALRYQIEGRSVEVGFEAALEPGIDRLIHEETIVRWDGTQDEVTQAERGDVIRRIEEYCRLKGLTYRIVQRT